MPRWNYEPKTKRRLPHWQYPDATLFVTFRLADSIPKSVIRRYAAAKQWLEAELKQLRQRGEDDATLLLIDHRMTEFRREWLREFEDRLHSEETGPTWLKQPEVAQLVADSLHYRDGKEFRLDAYCVMANHVHTVFAPYFSDEEWQAYEAAAELRDNRVLSNLMQSLKGYTAREANRLLGRSGQFWEHESYDHIVRNWGSYERIVKYVLNNPVKAGLVESWEAWPWSYQRKSESLEPVSGDDESVRLEDLAT